MVTNPIRILHVFAKMNRGGAETMIMNIYRQIDKDKIQFDFMVHTNEKCDFDSEIEEMGGRIYRVPRYKGKNHFSYIKAWKLFFEKHKEYKIIHGHIRSTAVIYLKIAKKYKLKAIMHSHSTSSGLGLSARIKDIYQYPLRFIADYYFACSLEAGKWLFGNGIVHNNKFKILKNAIDVCSFCYDENIRSKKRIEMNLEGKFVIGHVGRFNMVKNHSFLLEIFKEIVTINPNSVLLLVGDGEEKKSIKNKVEEMKIGDKVIFMGVQENISNLLQVMDIFVFPSLFEGLGISVIEAQASGLNCIVADSVPLEVEITDLVEFLSLETHPKLWAEKIFSKQKNNDRQSQYNKILEAGYEIKDTVDFLEKYYLGLV